LGTVKTLVTSRPEWIDFVRANEPFHDEVEQVFGENATPPRERTLGERCTRALRSALIRALGVIWCARRSLACPAT
jgi:hypothetical protein